MGGLERVNSSLATSRARVPTRTTKELVAARDAGLVSAAKVNAVAYVTHAALAFTAALSAEEAHLISQCPLGEARYKAIVDQFTGVAAAEIARLAW